MPNKFYVWYKHCDDTHCKPIAYRVFLLTLFKRKHLKSGCMISYCFYPANISTSDQRCFNVVDQRWKNVDPTLKMKQNPTSDFQCCTTLIQRRCGTLKQRWKNLDTTLSTLFQVGLNISKSCMKTSRTTGKYWFVNR